MGIGKILGKSHYEIFPDLPEHLKETHRRGLAGEAQKGEDDWVALDGKVHTSRWQIQPWGDSGVTSGGIILSLEDITERRRAEEERQKFVSLADRSLEFVGMCDLDFRPFYVNGAGMRLVGLDNLEAACRVKVQDYFFPEDQPFITNELLPASDTRGTWRGRNSLPALQKPAKRSGCSTTSLGSAIPTATRSDGPPSASILPNVSERNMNWLRAGRNCELWPPA